MNLTIGVFLIVFITHFMNSFFANLPFKLFISCTFARVDIVSVYVTADPLIKTNPSRLQPKYFHHAHPFDILNAQRKYAKP